MISRILYFLWTGYWVRKVKPTPLEEYKTAVARGDAHLVMMPPQTPKGWTDYDR